MPNMCYFQMKLTGPEPSVREMIEALQWSGAFSSNGLGRAFSFDLSDPDEIEKDPETGYISLIGEGDCANSVLSSLRELSGYKRSLESETKRLGMGVEYFSSEPDNCFQEHGIIVCGKVLTSESVRYEEYFMEDKSDAEIEAFCCEKGITREQLVQSLNCNGEYCEGGFQDFGTFSDLSAQIYEMQFAAACLSNHKSEFSIDAKIQSASNRMKKSGWKRLSQGKPPEREV